VINNRRAFTERLQEAFEAVLNDSADTVSDQGATITRSVDPTAFELAMLWDKIAIEYRKFKQMCCAAINLSEIEPDGSAELWRAVEALAYQVANEGKYPPPQPIATMRQAGISDEQIARIYGWFFAGTKEPEISKVQEEADKPGTHYNADTWVHPAKRNRIDAASVAWAGRTPRAAEYDDPNAVKVTTAPPSLAELIALGAPPAQIARLHGITEDEAAELLVKAGKEVVNNASDLRPMAEKTVQAGLE
jgi:hypothetical protein